MENLMENMKLFPQGLYLLSGVGAILLTLWATRLWIGWSLRHEWLDKPGHRKIHTQPIPLAGGLGIATSMLCILTGGIILAWLGGLPELARDALEYGYSSRGPQILGIGFGALSMLIIGLWDDQKQPSPAPKFLAQACVALMVTASGVRITLFMEAAWLHYLITCFWILLIVNACNFVDNMNGLCSGLATISALFFCHPCHEPRSLSGGKPGMGHRWSHRWVSPFQLPQGQGLFRGCRQSSHRISHRHHGYSATLLF